MHRWMVMSGIPSHEAKQRQYEHNLKLLKLDENVIKSKSKASGQRLEVSQLIALSFLHNQEHIRSFLGCISMLHADYPSTALLEKKFLLFYSSKPQAG